MRIILKKVRTETTLQLCNPPVLPTFLYGSENWTLTALQRRRIEAAETKLLRPLAGHILYELMKEETKCSANRLQQGAALCALLLTCVMLCTRDGHTQTHSSN